MPILKCMSLAWGRNPEENPLKPMQTPHTQGRTPDWEVVSAPLHASDGVFPLLLVNVLPPGLQGAYFEVCLLSYWRRHAEQYVVICCCWVTLSAGMNFWSSEMIKTEKILHLKSSRGRKVRVVREHYLREQVPCGSALCQAQCPRGGRQNNNKSRGHLNIQ